MKSFIHSLSKLVWIKRGFFIRTSFDRLWMEIFPFLFLILKGFYKGFQMRYHLFFNSNGKAVKTIKMFFWKSAMWYIMSMSVAMRLWLWSEPILWCKMLILKRAFHNLRVLPDLCPPQKFWQLIRALKWGTTKGFSSRDIRMARGQSYRLLTLLNKKSVSKNF